MVTRTAVKPISKTPLVSKKVAKKNKPVPKNDSDTETETEVEVKLEGTTENPPTQESSSDNSENKQETNNSSFSDNLSDLSQYVLDIEKHLSSLKLKMKEMTVKIKKLKTSCKKEYRKKSKKPNSNSNVYGFNAPVKISDELALFLNLEPGTKARRPEITSLINEYAEKNNLKHPDNKGIYLPDEKLKSLFGPPKWKLRSNPSQEGYDMFNLQKYMKQHFICV